MDDPVFWMNAKFDSDCSECEGTIKKDSRMVYDASERKAYCVDCGVDVAGEDPQRKGKK